MIVLAVLAGAVVATRAPLMRTLRRRSQPVFRLDEIQRGTIQATVSASGRVEPKLRVQIGTFVSGPIIELGADFNDDVKEGDILAKIDPAIYKASVQRDRAAIATATPRSRVSKPYCSRRGMTSGEAFCSMKKTKTMSRMRN